ncbi:MAG: hypothetical protein U9O64_08390 [Campylobacterota bacterium]|nr:hypothetical protein [Campylobacterota bacterium]
MSALQKLQEKIEEWRVSHELLKSENAQLKVELATANSSKEDQSTEIELLQMELQEKDAEIEKIIAQVEALLS